MGTRALDRISKEIKAFIFDLDGVVTRTASIHADSWKQMFDAYLNDLGYRTGRAYRPFDIATDYRRYVDGKPRYDGVASFLESRNIEIPHGSPEDSPGQETVCGLGNRKNELFLAGLQNGVEIYDSTVSLIKKLKDGGIKTAVVSSSKNCQAVLEAAELTDLFEVRVDGLVSEELNLAGKPQPDIFLEAAKRLEISPEEGCVAEDAVSGVEAAYNGEFRYVIGVDRLDQADELLARGADMVVGDLYELETKQRTSWLPSALDRLGEVCGKLRGVKGALFLDYDGTLTPIVERPDQAVLSRQMRETIRGVASRKTVAVVSGRDLRDVRERVGLENVFYAGSHGFEIEGPDGHRFEHDQAADALPVLDEVEKVLEERLQPIQGAEVERKRFSIAVHYRRVAEDDVRAVGEVVTDVAEDHSSLRLGSGKKVYELQPDVEWNKGKALWWIMDTLGLDLERDPSLYIGDDTTDEDAFAAVMNKGVGIVVHRGTPKLTFAHYLLSDTGQVQGFLEGLSGRLEEERS